MIEFRKIPLRLLLGAVLLSFAACMTSPHGDTPKELVNLTKTFEDTVRWGALENMVVFLNREQEEPVEIQEGLDNIRVTRYEIASPLSKVDEARWVQTAVIDYVLTDRQVVRRLIDRQVWVTDDEGETWYRSNPVPQFR